MPEPLVIVPVIYHREWADGFGARGWKLKAAVNDPEVIAATSETGRCIPTSVLIHDILDHHLCGLPLSGHRNEAIALHQLCLRTGANPLPDLFQMVDEDLMHDNVIGESIRTFLPKHLCALLPNDMSDDRTIAGYLIDVVGREGLRKALVQRMVDFGLGRAAEAREHYQLTGLDHARRGPLGVALQSLLAKIDALAMASGWEQAHGAFHLGANRCALHIDSPQQTYCETRFN